VNDSWMSDTARDLYKTVAAENRTAAYAVDGRPVKSDEAVKTLAAALKAAKGVAIIASAASSVEEQYLLKKLVDAIPAGKKLVTVAPHYAEGDGLLVSADRTPNLRGALLTGLIKGLGDTDMSGLKAAVDSGEIDLVLSVNESVTSAGLGIEDLKKLKYVSLGTHFYQTSQYSAIEIPLLTVFEKSGSFVNQQFRLQKFEKAVPGPAGVLPDVEFLAALVSAMGGQAPRGGLAAIWTALAAEIPSFRNLSFDRIPAEGVLIDGSAFASEKFREGKTLHFAPANV